MLTPKIKHLEENRLSSPEFKKPNLNDYENKIIKTTPESNKKQNVEKVTSPVFTQSSPVVMAQRRKRTIISSEGMYIEFTNT